MLDLLIQSIQKGHFKQHLKVDLKSIELSWNAKNKTFLPKTLNYLIVTGTTPQQY